MRVARDAGLLVIKLEPGDEWPEAPAGAVEEAGLQGGYFMGLGAVDRLVVAFFDAHEKRYVPTRLDEELEIASLVGNAGRDEAGDVILHTHCVASRRDGSTIGGHLVEARVSVTLEIGVVPAPSGLARRLDPRFGLKLLDL
jgi:predicted DNA-binding protein with PD1-like motif